MTPLITNHNHEGDPLSASAVSMRQKLNRILQIDQACVDNTSSAMSNDTMSLKVVVRPNPFFTSLTLDVTCGQGKHIIVRMFNQEEKIVKMFSWYLVKGINITNIGELENLPQGQYLLDMIDLDGDIVFSTQVCKQR